MTIYYLYICSNQPTIVQISRLSHNYVIKDIEYKYEYIIPGNYNRDHIVDNSTQYKYSNQIIITNKFYYLWIIDAPNKKELKKVINFIVANCHTIIAYNYDNESVLDSLRSQYDNNHSFAKDFLERLTNMFSYFKLPINGATVFPPYKDYYSTPSDCKI